LVVFLGLLALLPLVAAGQGFFFRVTDCATGEPIAGALVAIIRGSYGEVESTNATGYAHMVSPEGDYTYYVSMQGYRTRGGEARFTSGMVFSICLFKAAEGFWNIVPDILQWQGDIHAGGRGWAILRLKNLEDGVFNITRLEIWVAGYDRPISVTEIPSGALLEKVEKFFNVSVAPPQDSPTGRLKAELRLKAVYRQPDGRTMGPLTIYLDLDYVLVQPYRTMVVRLLDYWGINPVPNATAVFESRLTASQYVFKANSSGHVFLPRLPDVAYRLTFYYDSPYDGARAMAHFREYVLADLAANPVVRNKLYEAHVKVRSLSGKPVTGEVYLGSVGTQASLTQVSDIREEAVAVFINVPRGEYPVTVFWRGVEVFRGSIRVDEPLARPSPGGALEAVAEVGDIVLSLRDAQGRKLGGNVTLTLQPLGTFLTASEQASFIMLPRGSYTVVATVFNKLLKKDVEVGRFVYSIPENHGEHEARLGVFDARIRFMASDGGPAPLDKVSIEGEEFRALDGVVAIYGATVGQYRMTATYMGATVLDNVVNVSGPDTEVLTKIHRFKAVVETRDGEPLSSGKLLIEVAGNRVEAEVVNGTVSLSYLPEGTYPATVVYRDVEVFRESVEVRGSDTVLTVNVARPVLTVSDQAGRPIPNARVEVIGVGETATGADGSASLPQLPIRDYPFKVVYSGVEAYSGSLRPGSPANIQLTLVSLVVRAVNELGSPIEADIEVVRGGKLVGRVHGSEARFDSLPSGAYIVRASYGAKNAETQAMLDKPVNEVRVTVPIAFEIGAPLSLSELQTIMAPLVAAAVIAAALLLYSKARKKAEALLRK